MDSGRKKVKPYRSFFWKASQPFHLLTVLCYDTWESTKTKPNKQKTCVESQ